MSFFAVLIALLLEQARPLAYDNVVHSGIRSWVRWVRRNMDAGQAHHGPLVWSVAVGFPALLAGLVHLALYAYSMVLALMWAIFVLYVTLGFRQFSHHFTQIREALELGDERKARVALAHWRRVPVDELPGTELLRQIIEYSVMAAHKHVLGVLVCFVVFWVLGLGPAGAVLYRLADYLTEACRRGSDLSCSASVRETADTAWRWLDFLPARATALAFAIVGNFEEAVASWRQDADQFTEGNMGVVLAATAGALNVKLGGYAIGSGSPPKGDADFLAGAQAAPDANADGREPQMAHLASLVGLVWRSVVLWMLVLALLTLANLVG